MKRKAIQILCLCAATLLLEGADLKVVRFEDNPIIRPEMLPGRDGDNINGPSLIRTPAWLPNRLGRYYLYFAHHHGTYIRLAYADDLRGPWRIYRRGTLRLEQAVKCTQHVASPDVHVDEEARRIRMYFHCPIEEAPKQQKTFVATSADGIQFSPRDEILGLSYFRVFEWADQYYALAMPGFFYRSENGIEDFKPGPVLFSPNMRHSAVKIDGTTLSVFFTMVGESPERILLSTIDLSKDWRNWEVSTPRAVLAPERDYEGADLPLEPSERDLAPQRVRQLRDPAIFQEGDRTYLLYAVAGEQGIALAEIHSHP